MPSFPEEIWTRIFAHLECKLPTDHWWLYGSEVDCSTLKTLVSLCLVCRDFRRIAQSVLYRTVPLNSLEGQETKYHFARTLTEAPLLGHVTRVVSLDDTFPDHGFDKKEILNTVKKCPSIPTKLGMHLQRFGFSSRRTQEGFAVLMLAFMPQVQFVDCTIHCDSGLLPWVLSGNLENEYAADEDEDDPEYLDALEGQDPEWKNLATAPSEQTWLPCLKHVRLRTGDATEGTTGMSRIEAILLHPHLETLRLLGFDWTGHEALQMKWNDRMCNLESLQLKESIVDERGLQQILTRCRKLVRLSIELGDSRREGWDRPEDSWEVDLYRFGQLLREHGRNLIELELHTEEYQAANSTDGRLGSLRELSSLKHLRVTKVDLLGSAYERTSEAYPEKLSLEDALPRSLERLYLHFEDNYYTGKRVDEHGHQELYELITGGQFPDLHEVKVEYYLTDPSSQFGRGIVGWEVRTTQEHLWEQAASSGCLRSILVFSKMG